MTFNHAQLKFQIYKPFFSENNCHEMWACGLHWAGMYTRHCDFTWWRHQMDTLSALLAICAGNSPVPGEFPAQRPVTRSFDVFFDLRLNKRLRKQSWGWWFETPSRPLWRHCNEMESIVMSHYNIVTFDKNTKITSLYPPNGHQMDSKSPLPPPYIDSFAPRKIQGKYTTGGNIYHINWHRRKW